MNGPALLGIRSSALFAVSPTRRPALLDSCHMKSGNRDAAIIISPYHDAAALGVKASMIRGANGVSPPTGSNDRERFKRSRLQTLPNITNHVQNYNSPIRPEANAKPSPSNAMLPTCDPANAKRSDLRE